MVTASRKLLEGAKGRPTGPVPGMPRHTHSPETGGCGRVFPLQRQANTGEGRVKQGNGGKRGAVNRQYTSARVTVGRRTITDAGQKPPRRYAWKGQTKIMHTNPRGTNGSGKRSEGLIRVLREITHLVGQIWVNRLWVRGRGLSRAANFPRCVDDSAVSKKWRAISWISNNPIPRARARCPHASALVGILGDRPNYTFSGRG